MKLTDKKYSNLSFLLLLFALIIAGCSGGSTVADPDPDPDPNPPPTGANFDSGTLTPGESYSYTFTDAGVTDYICTIHSGMQGKVTVESGASSDPVTVTIDNMSFNPSQITVGPDTKVTWVNEDDVSHTATSQ